MPVRSGGSYTADPQTGEETLVERTREPDPVEVDPADVSETAPAAPAASTDPQE